MPDLYETLGVARTATPAELRAAYRRQAKTHHPDAPGGSEAKFGALKLALDVLSNPDQRRRYDATGEIAPPGPDNSQSHALQEIAAALDAVIGALLQQNRSPNQHDLAALVRGQLSQKIANAEQAVATIEKRVAILTDLVPRFRAKRGRPNPVQAVLRGQIGQFTLAIDNTRRQMALVEAALKLIDGLRFDAVAAAYSGWGYGTASTGTATGGGGFFRIG